jgi:hypothetical protein
MIHNLALNGQENMNEEEKLNLEIPIDDPTQVVLHKEMLLESSSDTRLVRLEQEFLDFNYCEYGRASEMKEVKIENKFKFQIQVKMVNNDIETNSGQMVKNPFQFKEEEFLLEPKQTASMFIKFRPYQPNFYFFQRLQCFVYMLNGNENKMRKIDSKAFEPKVTLSRSQSIKKSIYDESSNEEIDPPFVLNQRSGPFFHAWKPAFPSNGQA